MTNPRSVRIVSLLAVATAVAACAAEHGATDDVDSSDEAVRRRCHDVPCPGPSPTTSPTSGDNGGAPLPGTDAGAAAPDASDGGASTPGAGLPPIVTKNNLYVATTGSDANPGTQAAPFRTIQHAADVATADTTVHVAPGTYDGALRQTKSGTANARIRFVSDVQWGAKIVATGKDSAFETRGSYVDIVGFDVTSPDARLGIYACASTGGVRVIGNRVHDFTGVPCGSSGGGGIVQDWGCGATVGNDTIGNVVHRFGATKCNTVQGIYHSMKGGHIYNNITDNNAGWGIHLWHAATAVTIANNLSFANGSGGIVFGAGDAPAPAQIVVADDIVVTNNIVVENPIGITDYEYAGSNQLGANNRITNNLLSNNASDTPVKKAIVSGTIKATPGFVSYLADGSGDYHLLPTSPAVDKGVASGAPAIDFTGALRPQAIDLGPYERGLTAPPFPYTP